jgi:hypothetical protein
LFSPWSSSSLQFYLASLSQGPLWPDFPNPGSQAGLQNEILDICPDAVLVTGVFSISWALLLLPAHHLLLDVPLR